VQGWPVSVAKERKAGGVSAARAFKADQVSVGIMNRRVSPADRGVRPGWPFRTFPACTEYRHPVPFVEPTGKRHRGARAIVSSLGTMPYMESKVAKTARRALLPDAVELRSVTAVML